MNETYEDYLKSIYLISKKNRGGWVSNSEISKFLSVKPSSVTNMLYILKNLGFIDWTPRKSLRLTIEGRKIAEKIVRKYSVLKDFFLNVLNLENCKSIDEICCKIEHHLPNEAYKALSDLIISVD